MFHHVFVVFSKLFILKLNSFSTILVKSRIFYQLYRYSFLIYENFLSMISTIYTKTFVRVACTNVKAAGKPAAFWREYVGIEPTREVTSPPQRF